MSSFFGTQNLTLSTSPAVYRRFNLRLLSPGRQLFPLVAVSFTQNQQPHYPQISSIIHHGCPQISCLHKFLHKLDLQTTRAWRKAFINQCVRCQEWMGHKSPTVGCGFLGRVSFKIHPMNLVIGRLQDPPRSKIHSSGLRKSPTNEVEISKTTG